MEIENKPKNSMRIYEDQMQIHQFVEPEWMKILKNLLLDAKVANTMK